MSVGKDHGGEGVVLAEEGSRLVVTLADEASRNVLKSGVIDHLLEVLQEAERNPRIRLIVLTNTGRTFCAGADLSGASKSANTNISLRFAALLDQIRSSCKPVVGVIRGHAVGGGVGLAAACDISLATTESMLGFTEVRLGVIPAIIAVVCLPKMSRADAVEMFLRGRRFSAVEAAQIGLITRAIAASEIDDELGRISDDIEAGGPGALAAAKQLINGMERIAPEERFKWAADLSAKLFDTEEAKEGIAAYLEKRSPTWLDAARRNGKL